MALNEVQKQLILSVENDPGMGPDFLEDWATKEAGFDSSITDEDRIQAKLELAQAYHDTSINEAEEKRAVAEETSAATTGLEMEKLQGSINESKEKLSDPQNESVFDILEGGKSSLITKMATQLGVDSNTPEGKNEVMAFSDKIQNMWGLYIKGTVPEGFPLAIQENMSVALSFSLMKRLSEQNGDLTKKMNENAQGINKESGLSANIASLFGFLRKTTEFLPMMTKISRMASLIEFHQSVLFASDTDGKMNCEKLDCFNSPSACYQWMEKNNMILADKTPVESTTYEEAFGQSYTLDNDLLVSIANKVNYDESTHKFMRDTVIPKGTAILEMRNNAQENLNPIYAQLSMIGKMFGYSVSDMVGEGTIGKVLNFVSLLVCGCSLKGLDKKHFMAEDWKNFPQASKAGLSEAVAYASKFMDEYEPKEHGVNGSLLDKSILQQFESADYSKYEVNDTIPTAAMILPIVPTSFDALDDGLYHAMKSEKGFIPSATTLESIGLTGYYTTDEDGNSVFDMDKKEDLMDKLNTSTNRKALISIACQSTLTPDIIAGVAKNGGNREDVIALMYGSLMTSPDIMTKALEHDILDGVQLTQGIVILGMVNKGADSKKEQERVAEEEGVDPTYALIAGAGVEAGVLANTDIEKKQERIYNANQQREALPDPQSRYSPEFAEKIVAICTRLGIPDPNWLMNIIDKESGHTFSPSVKNGKGSGATGLIQFMPDDSTKTYKTIGGEKVEIADLEKMTAIEQLDYVEKYFQPYKGRLDSLDKAYMAVFYPAYLKYIPDNMQTVILTKGTRAYDQNSGMDTSKKGSITVQDVVNFVTKGQKVYFKPIEKVTPEKTPEAQKLSIDLTEQSIAPSKTVLFGASNAGTVAGVIEDTSSRKGVYSFPGESSKVLRQKADDVTERGERTIITSTVNNSYTTEEQAKKAAEDIQAIAQEAINAGSRPVIVLYPNPSNWSDKTVNPNRYEKFQHYNELMKTWCQSQTGAIKPQILDLSVDMHKNTFKRDESGYHVDKNVMKQMFTPYLSQ